MIIRSKAPFRLEFGGGGTDVAPFTDEHGGIVFNATIDQYAYCSIASRQDNEFNVHSLDYNVVAQFKDDKDFKFDGNLDLVKAVIKRMKNLSLFKTYGMDVVLHSDIPAGSGLGSSSTVCVALVGAMAQFYRIPLTQAEIGKLAYEIERIDLGIAGGLQDQYAAAFGGFNLMEFGKNLSVLVNPLRISQDIKNELLYHMVMINTGKARMSDGILRDQVGIYVNNPEKVLQTYIKLKEYAVEMKSAVVSGETEKFGKLLSEAWKQKKTISAKITNDHIENLYNTAMKKGAIGGRIMGAGGGGHMIFYVKNIENRRPLIAALEEAGARHVPFGFEDNGVQTWITKEDPH